MRCSVTMRLAGAFVLAIVLATAAVAAESKIDVDMTLFYAAFTANKSQTGGGEEPKVSFPLVDSMQDECYNDKDSMDCPSSASADYYGQDAQHKGNQTSYTDNGDGTVTDNVTGLVWQQTIDTDGDGDIDANDKMTLSDATSYCSNLTLAGKSDWRLPSIKEAYSLYDGRGTDISGAEEVEDSFVAFLDTSYFDFTYGDASAGERLIDMQYASSTEYVSGNLLFGVNFADGRIKGYELVLRGEDKTFNVQCVRGDTYGTNNFVDNGDGTITDQATRLMWTQDDSGKGLNWQEALAWAQTKNSENHLGYSDWRLPDIKELQSIVDYSRSPDATSSAAIDAVFNTTQITNEDGAADYPYFWSSTTHLNYRGGGDTACYVAFGRGLGYDTKGGKWIDVHGAGCQRSDPKAGNPADYPEGHGPQGDAVRIYNYVRLVRD